jgi:co-chaperonin GroES (HSP10)
VVAVADDQTKVAAGDEILVRQHAGQSFEYDNQQLVLIHVNDIVGVIK